MRLSSLAFASYVCVHTECTFCSWPRTSPCSPRPRLGTSLSPSSVVRFIFLEIVVPSLIDFLRMLTSSHPPPSLLLSRNDFSTSVAVRIASFDIVLSDSYSFPGSAQGSVLDLLLNCSEFLFVSFNFLAFGVCAYSTSTAIVFDATSACPFHASCFPYAVFSSALVSSAA